MGITVILCQGQVRSRKVMEVHFLIRWYATHDLRVILHAGSDEHGYISPKSTFLIISVFLKHKNSSYHLLPSQDQEKIIQLYEILGVKVIFYAKSEIVILKNSSRCIF